jgi:hypothetical protein
MKQRKQAALSTIITAMLIGIGIYFGMFLYWQGMSAQADKNMSSEYQEIYDKLEESKERIDAEQVKLETAIQDVSEADSTWQVAWNGLKGLGTTLKSLVAFVDITHDSTTVLQTEKQMFPQWAMGLCNITERQFSGRRFSRSYNRSFSRRITSFWCSKVSRTRTGTLV